MYQEGVMPAAKRNKKVHLLKCTTFSEIESDLGSCLFEYWEKNLYIHCAGIAQCFSTAFKVFKNLYFIERYLNRTTVQQNL